MPVYEYLCRTCDRRFEARRSMSEAGAPIDCPEGHTDITRLLSAFSSVGRSGSEAPRGPAPSGPAFGGCGAGCACAS